MSRTGAFVAAAFAACALASSAAAREKRFTGVFQGEGKTCGGKLTIKAKTIDWRNPFETCRPARYKIVEQTLSVSSFRIVYEVKDRALCGFAAITIEYDPRSPDDWTATGYRSKADVGREGVSKKRRFRCKMEKLGK